ncbi:MAG: glycosyltransferase family 2 protein [Saprospiraceae bacterium]
MDVAFQTPILFITFNRPAHTARVFEAIRAVRPSKLYIATDGPRAGVKGEDEKVKKVRKIATSVDWPCEVRTKFQDRNLGCKYGPYAAISWLFEHETQGIILEDDCLPNPDFFTFCETLLERYACDERIWTITGMNAQGAIQRGNASYFFTRYSHLWGWATWRRAWEKADMDIVFWPKWKASRAWKSFWPEPAQRRFWEHIFDKVYQKGMESAWDYAWVASIWYHDGLSVAPNRNLVSNIGFGPESTHTRNTDTPIAALPTEPLGLLSHPDVVKRNLEAERYTFDHAFSGASWRHPWYAVLWVKSLAKRVLRPLKPLLKRE